MATVASTVMPTQQPVNVSRWTQMVKDALNQRNRYQPGTPEYQKYNQLYISRAQHLRTLQQPGAQQPSTQPSNITPINQLPPQNALPQFMPSTPTQTFQPVVNRRLPQTTANPPQQQVLPKEAVINTRPTTYPWQDPRPTPETETDKQKTEDEKKTSAEDVASEGQNLEYDFKNRELTLNNQFRYYQSQMLHNEFVQNLQASLKQMRLDFEIQGRQLDNEETQILGDLENRATELANQMKLGMADIDAQKAIAQLQAQVQQQLGNKGLDVDLQKSMAQIEAQTQTGLTQMYLDQEKAAGELGLQKQLGLTEMGLNAAGQLATNRSNERMAAINATGQMAPQMRQIASNERVSFGNMGANLANQSQAINAQRQAQLMQMGLSAQQAMRQTETERQLGLTGQTMQGYATLAQMNQQPENWLSAFYAMRGMNVPQNARTGQAESLGQYLQQLSALGLNIDPNAVAAQDRNANAAFNTGQGINPNMLSGDIGALTNNYNNAAFQGLGRERDQAENITRRMMDAGEFGRAQDANLIQGFANRAVNEGLEKNNVLGQRGYDSQHMYNRLIPQLARSDYYKPPVTDQSKYDPVTYPKDRPQPKPDINRDPVTNPGGWDSVPDDNPYSDFMRPAAPSYGEEFTPYDATNDYNQYFGGAMGAGYDDMGGGPEWGVEDPNQMVGMY